MELASSCIVWLLNLIHFDFNDFLKFSFISVRICQKDADYYSYTEVPIKCRLHGQSSQGQHENIDYNLAQAAFLGKPGSELATSLGITAQDDILFVAFSKSHDQFDVYNKPSNQSAVCVYALSAVHRKFTQNIQHCFNGNGYQGLDYINPSQQCVPTVSSILFSHSFHSFKCQKMVQKTIKSTCHLIHMTFQFNSL